MWVYYQESGELDDPSGAVRATGYSGADDGKNNPSMQSVHDVGPIPQGSWIIGAPVNTEKHGPYVLPLTPETGTTTFGRSGFLIHGDSIEHPGCASEGCIIMPPDVRHAIWESGDHRIVVLGGK